MSDANNRLKDSVERTSLLVAYAAGHCTPEETRVVQEAASSDPRIAKELEFLRLLRQQIKEQPEEETPGEFGWFRLKRAMNTSNLAGKRWIKIAAVAAAIVMVVQASLWLRHGDDTYRTLGNTPAHEQLIQLKFQPDAKQSDVQQLLREVDAEIIAGPSAEGLYRLQLKASDVDDEKLEGVIATLKGRTDLVAYAGREP